MGLPLASITSRRAARRRAERRWIRPFALRGCGLIVEGLAVWGLGLIANAEVSSDRLPLPMPLITACGYITLLMLQHGLVEPPTGAKTGLAIRALASTFICSAMVAIPSMR